MSTINVIVTPIEILPHENADSLELARIGGEGGFISVVGKGQFQQNELAIYLPPDSVLTEEIMESLAKNKITMKSNRLRAIKIRSIVSEGLCLKPEEWLRPMSIYEGCDVTEELGITKYEPKRTHTPGLPGQPKVPEYENKNFYKFTDIERFEKHPKIFRDTPEVVATVKYHGTNFRAGWVDVDKLTWWQKIVRWLTKETPQEFLVGSHNTIRLAKKNKHPNAKEDTYRQIADKYELMEAISEYKSWHPTMRSVIVYGEIIGPSIQKGYEYGLEEHELRIFDVKVDGEYVSWDRVKVIASLLYVPTVEEVYRGPWSLNRRALAQLTDTYNGKKYVREGIVVKDVLEEKNNPYHCRTVAKIMNPKYLLDKTNSDFH